MPALQTPLSIINHYGHITSGINMGEKNGLWLGLFAFVVGIVLWVNLSSIVPYSYNYGNAPSRTQVMISIVVEIIIAVMILGGLLLMILNWDVKSSEQSSTTASMPTPPPAPPVQQRTRPSKPT